jgi:hypothetical protein
MCLCPALVVIVGVVMGAGGVVGWTVVFAAVVIVVVVAIFVVVDCCSWQKVEMLRRCERDRKSSHSLIGVVHSPIGNVEVGLKSGLVGSALH